MKTKIIAVAKGDGAAPEMMEWACKIAIEAAKLDNMNLSFEETPMGWNAYEKYSDTLPEESFQRATELGILFFGGVGDPKIDTTIGKERPEMRPEARCLLRIRKEWGLLLNFRPMIYYPELAELSNVHPKNLPTGTQIEQHWIRYLLKDSYFGTADLKDQIPEETRNQLGIKTKQEATGDEQQVVDLAYYERNELVEYFTYAFNYAKNAGLPLISIDKNNVMARSILWRSVCKEVSKNFPEVELRHQLVDSANALLPTPAKLHGVIACGNEHGDILSDGAAAMLGSMGMMCSSAINPSNGMAMFESGAGTAADIAGQDKANPIGRILTAAMMLDHIGCPNGAKSIRNAVLTVIKNGYRTQDILPPNPDNNVFTGVEICKCSEMGELILKNLVA